MKRREQEKIAKELWSKVQKHNLNAFEELYNLYKIQIFNFCYSILKSKTDCQEILQDTFLKLWQSRKKFDEVQTVNGLIYRIAKNLTLNKIRRKSGQPKYFEIIQEDDLTLNQTENDVLFHEMREILDTAIEALPPMRQKIFRLSREHGLTNEEIGDQLNISVNTVKTQLRKALSFLRNYMEWISV